MTQQALRRHSVLPQNPSPLDPRWRSRAMAVYGVDWAADGITDGSLYFADRSDTLMRNAVAQRGSMHSYFAGEVPARTYNVMGRALDFDGSRNSFSLDYTGLANGASPDESCIVVFSPGSSTGSQNMMGYANVFSSSLSDYGRGVGIEGGSLFVWGNSAVGSRKASYTLPALGSLNVVGVRFSNPGAVFLNGVLLGNPDLSHSWADKLACGVAIAATEGSGVAKFTGSLGLRAWFSDGLTDTELEELTSQPLRLFAPRKRLYLVPNTGASGVTIPATVGNAVAAGSAATVSSPITIAATTGNAAAAGSTAAVASSITIAASAGNAVAAGPSALVSSDITIGAGIGDAVAAGVTASISTGDSIEAGVGNAVAAGATATVSSPITISCSVGDAAAAGSAASVSTGVVVSCSVGNAVADGLVADIASAITIAGSIGNATAAGVTATISTSTSSLTAAEIAEAVWDEPLAGATQARQIMSGMADFLRSRGFLP